jgi:hypothetical protein
LERSGRRAWVAALTLSAALGGAAPARAENPVIEGAGVVFDLVVLRPLGVGQLLFGAACFVPMALFAGTSIGEPLETFVTDPYEATFIRPLGEFEEE